MTSKTPTEPTGSVVGQEPDHAPTALKPEAPVLQESVDKRAAGRNAEVSETAAPSSQRTSKAEVLIRKLKSARGLTIDAMTGFTGWQAHSVRGFLSASVKKKLGHNLTSEIGNDGVRHYRILAPKNEG